MIPINSYKQNIILTENLFMFNEKDLLINISIYIHISLLFSKNIIYLRSKNYLFKFNKIRLSMLTKNIF